MFYAHICRESKHFYLLIDPSGQVDQIARVLGSLIEEPADGIKLFVGENPLDSASLLVDTALTEDSLLTYKLRRQDGVGDDNKPIYVWV